MIGPFRQNNRQVCLRARGRLYRPAEREAHSNQRPEAGCVEGPDVQPAQAHYPRVRSWRHRLQVRIRVSAGLKHRSGKLVKRFLHLK